LTEKRANGVPKAYRDEGEDAQPAGQVVPRPGPQREQGGRLRQAPLAAVLAGEAANRRVEVLILPTTVRSPAVARVRGNAPSQRHVTQRRPEFNKDSTVGTFNK